MHASSSIRRLSITCNHINAGGHPPQPFIRRLSSTSSFKALVVNATKKGELLSNSVLTTGLTDLPRQDPDATLTIRTTHSSLNYKDGMIVMGQTGVVPAFPIVPGIDLAGEVVDCDTDLYKPGDRVVITGNKIGQHFDGGYAQVARVKAEWAVPIPPKFTAEQAMVIGTAGMTAMMCITHLERAGELTPEKGEVLVTGAAGGLGCMAVAILAKLGYQVVASTGRAEQMEGQLKALGAARVIGRLEYNPKRPLDKQLWAGVVDSVGSTTLSAAIAQTKYRGLDPADKMC